MAIETITIEDLDRNGLQTRVALDESTVVEYADAMRGKAHFPPVTAFCDGEKIYLADGFHRVEATMRCGWRKIKADVRTGTFADALKHALGANANHGLRRSNADKQRCLQLAWENRRELFGANDPTADWLAETCGISKQTADRFYTSICDKVADLTPVRQNAKGRTYTVPTRPPMRKAPPPTRTVASNPLPVRPAPVRPPVKKGYHIGPDGKQHADGVALDRFGVEIPDRIVIAFTVGTEALKNLAKIISQAKQESKAINLQRCTLNLEAAYAEAKAAIPFCVCPACQGNGCKACRDTGYQTEDQFDRNPPELLDEIYLSEFERRKN